ISRAFGAGTSAPPPSGPAFHPYLPIHQCAPPKSWRCAAVESTPLRCNLFRFMTPLHSFGVLGSTLPMRKNPTKRRGRGAPTARAHSRWLHRLVETQAGSTIVEFAIVGFPFFLLLLGAFDIGFYYWGTQELENATAYGARLVRTGQVQTAPGINQSDLKAQICGKTAVLVGCVSRLRIDVRSGQSLANITPPSPLNNSGVLKSDAEFVYSPGAASDVVLVSAFFNWQLLLKPSGYLLRATAVTRNEPF